MTQEPFTIGNGCGYWATPSAADSVGSHGGGQGRSLRTDIYNLKHGMCPTPRANERGAYQRDKGKKGKERPTLLGLARMYPTPRATDATHGGRVTPRKARHGGNLIEEISRRMYPTPTSSMMTLQDLEQARYSGDDVRRPKYENAYLPTPQARDYRTGDRPENRRARNKYHHPNLNDVAAPGGQLNPLFVEWLMGFPIGWTGLRPLGRHRFRPWRRSHSLFSVRV